MNNEEVLSLALKVGGHNTINKYELGRNKRYFQGKEDLLKCYHTENFSKNLCGKVVGKS